MTWFLAAALSLTFAGEQITEYRSELVRVGDVYRIETCSTTVRLDVSPAGHSRVYHVTDLCGVRVRSVRLSGRPGADQLSAAVEAVRYA